MPIDVSRSLFIKNDAGEFVPVPMLKGEPGSDANVTFENITNALGYIAADDEFVQEQAQEISQINESITEISSDVETLKNTVPEVVIAEYGVTTYEEIKAATDAGKQVYCYKANEKVMFVLSSEDITYVYFSGIVAPNTICSLRLEKSVSTWKKTTYNLSTEVRPTRTYTFPSDKAVADYVGNVLASPSTMPTLTAEEQAAARQRIGLENRFELIETIDLSNSSETTARTATPDGTPYNYIALGLRCCLKAGTTNVPNIYILTDTLPGGIVAVAYVPSTTADRYMGTKAEIRHGSLTVLSAINSGAFSNQVNVVATPNGIMNDRACNRIIGFRITMDSGKSYAEGSYIEVYGVRA